MSATASITEAEKQQIDMANQLAQAAGLAGASQADIDNIMKNGSAQMGKALADLTNGIAQDIQSLNDLTSPISAGGTVGLLAAINGGFGGNDYKQQQEHAQQAESLAA